MYRPANINRPRQQFSNDASSFKGKIFMRQFYKDPVNPLDLIIMELLTNVNEELLYDSTEFMESFKARLISHNICNRNL